MQDFGNYDNGGRGFGYWRQPGRSKLEYALIAAMITRAKFRYGTSPEPGEFIIDLSTRGLANYYLDIVNEVPFGFHPDPFQ